MCRFKSCHPYQQKTTSFVFFFVTATDLRQFFNCRQTMFATCTCAADAIGAYCATIAITLVSLATSPVIRTNKRRLRSSFFLLRQRTCDNFSIVGKQCLQPALVQLTRLAHTAQQSLLRSFLSLQVLSSVPSVMVYKSFLIDHHFCIFRGIFAHF